MRISEHVIIGDTIAHEGEEILSGIRQHSMISYPIWYAVTTADEESPDLMYILPSVELRNHFYWDEKRNFKVLGIAGSLREARLIVKQLVMEGYEKGDLLNLKQYLRSW